MSFFDVRYQERAQRILLRTLAGQRVPHAYVFHGPQGVGKRLLADRLAARLLCGRARAFDPPNWAADALAGIACVDACGECEDCRLVRAGTHPDLHVIHRELRAYHPDADVRKKKGIELGIDVVRHFLIDAAGRRPMQGRAKVFLVEEAERLSDEAQNAMLKTLEEPPPTTFIVLLTRSIDRLLPTTRSRCHLVPFRALPTEFVESALRELRPDLAPDAAAYLARLSDGRLGAAVRFADDGLAGRKRALGESVAALGPATIALFAKTLLEQAGDYAKQIADRDDDVSDAEANRVGLRALLAALGAFYTDALRRRCGAAALPVNVDQAQIVDAIVRRHSRRGLTQAIREVVDAEANIDRNANATLAIESLAFRLTQCA